MLHAIVLKLMHLCVAARARAGEKICEILGNFGANARNLGAGANARNLEAVPSHTPYPWYAPRCYALKLFVGGTK